MSTTIDERVVSMQFDNAHFEKNVSTTISTLDKLKAKLNLDGAAKGLENIDSAANKINLSGLTSAADNVAVKFSHMQMTIQHQLDRIVDSAVNAGTRLAKSLSVDQITAGWTKYGQKTSSVQTIMNATGASIDEVNGYLNKLMWFSDETSYGFTDMTQALGQLTSAGGKVEKLLPMIMGIANATAFAGKGTTEFSRAIYNLNQSYSAGHLQYMDWKSLDMAGVSSKQLKQTFIEIGEAMGKIEEGEVTVANFGQTLKKQWADTEVMEAAFGRFAEMTELAYEMVQSGEVKTASDAYKILAQQYDGVSITAAKAAQEAKTFTEAIDATKDAVSSSWMRTFELIFGNYQESKELWTDVANQLWDIFASGGDSRNDLLDEALTSNWTKLTRSLTEAGLSTEVFDEALRKTLTENGQNVEALIDEFGSLEKAFTSGAVESKLLKKALRNISSEVIDLSKIERILNFGKTGEDVAQLQEALETLGHSVGEHGIDGSFGPDTLAAIKAFQEISGLEVDGIVGPATLKALKTATRNTENWSDENKELIESYDDLIDAIDKTGGRELLAGSLTNALSGLAKVVETIKEAFANIFNITPDTIYDIVKAIHSFSEKLIMSDETADKLRSTLEGLFAIVDSIAIIVGGALKIAFKTIGAVFGKTGSTLLDITSGMSGGLVDFRDTVKLVVENITSFFTEQIPKWIEEFKETEFFKTVAGWFEDASEKISDAVDKISEKFENFQSSAFIQRVSSIGDVFRSLGESFANSELGSGIIDTVSNTFTKLKDFFSKIPKFTLSDGVNIASTLEESNVSGISGALASLGGAFKTNVVTKAKTFFKNINGISWDEFKIEAFNKFVGFWTSAGEKIRGAFEACKDFAQQVKEFVFGSQTIKLKDILDLAEKILGIIVLIKALNLLSGVVKPFDNITDALNNIASSIKWNAISSTFKSIALALAALTLCIVAITQIKDMDKARSAAIMLGSLLVVMGGVAIALGVASDKLGGDWSTTTTALSLLAMMGALLLLVHAIKEIDGMTLKDPVGTFGMLTGALLAMVIGMSAVSKAGGSSFKSIAAVLTLITALKMLLDVIEAYDEFDWTGRSVAIKKMCKMLFVLSAALAITTLGGNGGSVGMAFTLLAMVYSLKLLLSAIKEFANVDDATMEKGGQAVVKLLGVMTIMAVSLSLANKGTVLEKGQRSVNSFVGLATALLAVVVAIWLLGKMATTNEEMLIKGGNAVGQILLAFAAVFTLLGIFGNSIKTASIGLGISVAALAALGLVIWEIGAIIRKLKQNGVDDSAIGTAVSLTLVLIAMTGVLAACVGLGKILQNPKAMLGLTVAVAAFAALGLVVWEIGAILRKLNQNGLDSGAIGAAAAISLMIIAMTGVLAACAGLGVILQVPSVMLGLVVAIAALGALGLVIWEIGAILRKLSQAGLDDSAIGAVDVISAMIIAMTVVLAACSALGLILQIPSVMLGLVVAIAALGALGLVIWEIGAIIRKLKQNGLDDSAIGTVNVLAQMLNALVNALTVLTVIGMFSIGAFSGVAALDMLALELGITIFALSKIKDTETAKANIENIILLLGSLTNMLLVLAVAGSDALSAAGAIDTLIELVEDITVFAIAVGGIANLFGKGINNSIEKGLEVLKTVANGLGDIIGAFGEGLTSSLPTVAENLSGFGEKLGGFITAMNNVDDDIITKSGNLAEAIMTLTKGNFLNTISSLGDGTLSTLGDDLSNFATNASTFITSMDSVKAETATNMDTFASAVSTLNDVCDDNNLSPDALITLGEGISTFATSIKNASVSLSSITDQDVENIIKASNAGVALADLNKAIPRSGGTWQDIAGEKDLADWGTKISAFADSLIAYSNKVSGSTIDSDAIQKSADAAGSITALNEEIPKTGGVWQDIAGNKDLDQWGLNIVSFADALIKYSDKISGADIDKEAILKSAEAANALAEVNNNIPTSGGLLDLITGGKDLTAFGAGLSSLATGILDYATSALLITDAKIQGITRSGTAIDEIRKVTELLPDTGGAWGKLWGEKDPLSFGAGVTSLMEGVQACVNVSSTITTDSIASISNIGTAITEIETAINAVPDYINTTNIENFKTAIENVKAACIHLDQMSSAGYDFTGVTGIQDGITNIVGMLRGVNSQDLYDKCIHLKLAIDEVVACSETLTSINDITYGGIDTFNSALSNLSGANIDGVINAFSGKSESMSASVGTLVNSMAHGLAEGSVTVSAESENLANAAVTAVSNKASEFKTAAEAWVSNLISGLSGKLTNVKNSGIALGNEIVNGLRSTYIYMYSVGQDLGNGLILGINSKKTSVWWAGYYLGKAAVEGEKAGQNSESPSKETIKAGKWLGEGLVIGMENMGRSVYNAGKSMGVNAVGSIANSIRSISDLISTDIDAQPTIRPVLDLSDVRSGVNAIGGMFGTANSVGVQANIGVISSMMNNRSQNGINSDVVSAIDRLNRKMDNFGNTTYQVNGVTYDDGSNIAEAVRTITRAAVRERRV